MSKNKIPNPTKIFHITSIDNLRSIFSLGVIRAKNLLVREEQKYANIAHNKIQAQRKKTLIPIGKKGELHDYVPFYFAPRSPMLWAIHKNQVEGYTKGQEHICHLVTSAQKVREAKMSYVFTRRHAITQPVEFYDTLEDFHKIDWEIFFEDPLLGGYSRYWNDNHLELEPRWMDRKSRRQAEFLVHQQLPWNLIEEIGVINNSKADEVNNIFTESGIEIPLKVKPEWYY